MILLVTNKKYITLRVILRPVTFEYSFMLMLKCQ